MHKTNNQQRMLSDPYVTYEKIARNNKRVILADFNCSHLTLWAWGKSRKGKVNDSKLRHLARRIKTGNV